MPSAGRESTSGSDDRGRLILHGRANRTSFELGEGDGGGGTDVAVSHEVGHVPFNRLPALRRHASCTYSVHVPVSAQQVAAFIVRLRRAVSENRVEIRAYALDGM